MARARSALSSASSPSPTTTQSMPPCCYSTWLVAPAPMASTLPLLRAAPLPSRRSALPRHGVRLPPRKPRPPLRQLLRPRQRGRRVQMLLPLRRRVLRGLARRSCRRRRARARRRPPRMSRRRAGRLDTRAWARLLAASAALQPPGRLRIRACTRATRRSRRARPAQRAGAVRTARSTTRLATPSATCAAAAHRLPTAAACRHLVLRCQQLPPLLPRRRRRPPMQGTQALRARPALARSDTSRTQWPAQLRPRRRRARWLGLGAAVRSRRHRLPPARRLALRHPAPGHARCARTSTAKRKPSPATCAALSAPTSRRRAAVVAVEAAQPSRAAQLPAILGRVQQRRRALGPLRRLARSLAARLARALRALAGRGALRRHLEQPACAAATLAAAR
mmetsp:Transcript_9594/g.33716  ORF Transcript_9594/g.33716 Transcript_9594/m.33716 type:complete len:393 (-) Transcript_9594:239-1417(-)